MTSALQLDVLDLRHFSAAQLHPLLREEAALWQQRLHWDYTHSTSILLDYLDGRILPGLVAIDTEHGNRILGYGDLARPEVASVQRALTEAYVALDALGLAETACTAWREADPAAPLDPVELSPKILRACVAAAGIRVAPAASSAPPPESKPPSLLRDRRRRTEGSGR